MEKVEEFYKKRKEYLMHVFVKSANCWKTRGQLFSVTDKDGKKHSLAVEKGMDKNWSSGLLAGFGVLMTKEDAKGTLYQWDLDNYNLPDNDMVDAITVYKNKLAQDRKAEAEKKVKDAEEVAKKIEDAKAKVEEVKAKARINPESKPKVLPVGEKLKEHIKIGEKKSNFDILVGYFDMIVRQNEQVLKNQIMITNNQKLILGKMKVNGMTVAKENTDPIVIPKLEVKLTKLSTFK